jgi:hypothetical protein
MAEDVHRRAKEIGTVCSVTYPLPSEELKQHGMDNYFLFALGGGGGGGGGGAGDQVYLFSWILGSLSEFHFRFPSIYCVRIYISSRMCYIEGIPIYRFCSPVMLTKQQHRTYERLDATPK